MPGKPSVYEPVFSGAVATFTKLFRHGRRQMLDLIFQLAEQPSQSGDYATGDERGHDVQHLRLGGWRISFWADHAVRELRIVNLARP